MSLKKRNNAPLYISRRIGYVMAAQAALLTACQTAAVIPASGHAQTGVSAPHDGLAPRELSPGECGLFVWAGEARRFILFAQNGQNAVLAKDGAETTLTAAPTDRSGDLYGQLPVQNFTDSGGTAYALALNHEEAIDGGIRYSAGTWRYKDAAGWDVLTPVYGLSTCQAR